MKKANDIKTIRVPGFFIPVTRRLGLGEQEPAARLWGLLDDNKVQTGKATRVAALYGMKVSTFNSKFERAGLPTAKVLLSQMRFICAGSLLHHGATVAEAAEVLHISAPQALARSMRLMRGFTPSAYREAFVLSDEMERFMKEFIDPYAATWRAFIPSTPMAEPAP